MLLDIYETADELPIFNYYMLFKTYDFRYFFKNKERLKVELNKEEFDFLQQKFDTFLFSQSEFILNENQKLKILLLIKELLFEFENKPVLRNEIEYLRKKIELNLIKKTENKEWNLTEEVAALSKWLGFQIDKFTLNTNDYFAHRKNFLRFLELQKENNK